MASPAPPPPSQLLSLAVGGALCLAGAMGIGRFLYTPLLPVMVDALGLSKTDAGLIASANFLGYLVGALAAAGLRLPGSPWLHLMFSLVAGVLTTLAMGLTDSFAAFVVLRFGGGLASAFVMVFASSLVLERIARAGRAGLSSVHFAGVGAGILASSALVPALASLSFGWRGMWVAGAALFAAAAAGALALISGGAGGEVRTSAAAARTETADGSGNRAGRPAAAADRIPAALVISYGLFGFGYITTATFIVAIVRGTPGMGSLEGPVWGVVGLAAMASVALWTRIAAVSGVLRTYAFACVVEAVGVAASVTGGAVGLILGGVLLGGTFVGITALGLVAARAFAPAAPKRVIGLMTASFGVGQIIGPLVAGALRDATGSFLLPSLLAAVALLVAAALAVVAQRAGAAA